MSIDIQTAMAAAYGKRMDKKDREVARLALGLRIRKLREEQKISLRKFALMVGLNKDYMVSIEHGRKSATIDTLMKIAGGLDVTMSELMEGVEIPIAKDNKTPKTVNYEARDMKMK